MSTIEWGGTPGPWLTQEHDNFLEIQPAGTDGEIIVAEVGCLVASLSEQKTNARAIAKVPEMVDVLRMARRYVRNVAAEVGSKRCRDDLATIDSLLAEIDGKT